MPPGSRWSRRAAAAVALAAVAAACPDPRPPPAPQRPPPAGTVRLGYPEEPPTLNPATDPSPASAAVLRPLLPSFFLVTPDLRYQPYLLAKQPEVRVRGDTMTVRFRIRDEARWSDGRPVTVDDVAFTARVMSSRRLAVARPDGFDHVSDVVADSPKAGRLVLSPPLASWRELFSAGRYVLPAHAAERLAEVRRWNRGPPVTAGPFTLHRWIPGRAVIMRADPRFWGPRALVERLELAFVPDPTTAIQLMRAGALDAVAPMLGISWGRRLEAIPEVEVSSARGPRIVHLVFNASTVPRETRRRVARAIDRERMTEILLRDEGLVAQGVLAPEQRGYVAAWSRYGGAQNPGPIPGASELSLAYIRTELLDLVARAIHAELRGAGVDVELIPLEADVFHETFFPERRYDLALWEWRGSATPQLWRWFRVPGAAAPPTALRDRRLSALHRRMEGGGDRGAEAARLIQQRLASLAPVLPLFQPEVTIGWRRGVAGPAANPSIDGPLWNAWAWSKDEAARAAA